MLSNFLRYWWTQKIESFTETDHQSRFARTLVSKLGTPEKTKTSWWFQPIWKICLSKWESSPSRDENKKCLKPTPRKSWAQDETWWMRNRKTNLETENHKKTEKKPYYTQLSTLKMVRKRTTSRNPPKTPGFETILNSIQLERGEGQCCFEGWLGCPSQKVRINGDWINGLVITYLDVPEG